MKEMTIEQKAKAYDKAIEHARSLLKTIGNATLGNLVLKNEFKNMFPVLEESEDEMIRKTLIKYFRNCVSLEGINGEDISNWLEKQGEQKPSEWHREDEQNLNACLGYIPDEFLRRWLTDIIHVKYDKPADKVEPKIKAGDWVVCNNGPHHIFQVIERSWPNAKYRDINGTEIFLNVNTLDKQYHLWTIQDAKDGDVLAVEHIGRYKFPFIAIYKNYGLNFFNSYCSIGFDGKFYEADTEHVLDDIHPATKEQRDLLFQKIKENGYEWDAEKKELKKVEQKPAEEYNITGIGSKNAQGKLGKMIKNLKPINEVLEQGSAWSEEDEKMIWAIPLVINTYPKQEMFYGYSKEKLISWIKSIKDRVQLQDRINIEVWVTKNKQWILKLNGKVVRGQWGDEPQCIFKQFFYLSEIGLLK